MKTFFLIFFPLLFLSACDNSLRISFESDTSSVLETDGSALISVSLNRSNQSGPADVNAPNTVGNQEVRVPYTVTGTAIFGTNHQLASGVIVFPSKSKNVKIKVPVLHHTEFDGDRTIILTLGTPEGAQLGSIPSHTLTVQEVDIAPLIDFDLSTQSVTESAGAIQLGVHLEYASQVDAQVDLTFSGTAQVGTHFLASSTLTISAGQTSANFPVTLLDNLSIDGDKTLIVTMTNPDGALLGNNSSFTLTLVDDDNQPTVSFSASTQSVSESAGIVNVSVTMTKTYLLDVTVPFTVGGTASQSADHNLVNGSITVLAGSLTGATSFNVTNDALDESNETVLVTMGSLINGNPGAITTQTITITDDDPTPTVQFSTATQNVSEAVGTVIVQVNLSAVSGQLVTVPFTVTGTASHPADHNLVNGNINITAGASSGTTSFSLVNDSLYEGNETVILTIGTPTHATASGVVSQTVTLVENDPMPDVSFTFSSSSVAEGNSGQTSVSVTVNLSSASGMSTSIPFSWSGTAFSGSDYSPQTSSPLIIAPGNTTGSISFNVMGDTMYESNETVTIQLGSPTGASLGSPTSFTGTLTNDDPLPTVYFNGESSSVSEEAGLFVINIIATNTHESSISIPVTVSGTASNPSDHDLPSGTLNLNSGTLIGNLSFNLVNDLVVEGNETVIVTLGSPTNASLGSPSVFTLTINDNDRTFDLKDTILWMDADYGLEALSPSSDWKWEPRYSAVSGNCGMNKVAAEKISSFWQAWVGLFLKRPEAQQFDVNLFEGGSVFVLERETHTLSDEPPHIEEFFARNCTELRNVLSNPIAEIVWNHSRAEENHKRNVIDYLKTKYGLERSE